MGSDQVRFSVDVVIQGLQSATDVFAFEVFPRSGVSEPLKLALDVPEDLGWHLPRYIFGAQVIDVAVDSDKIEPAVVIKVAQLAAEAELIQGEYPEFGTASTIDEDTGKCLQIERGDFVVEVRHDDIEESIAVLVAAGDPHASLSASDCIDGNAGRGSAFGEVVWCCWIF